MFARLSRRFPNLPKRSTTFHLSPALRIHASGFHAQRDDPQLTDHRGSQSYQLLATNEKAGDAEDGFFNSQVKNVQAWWSSPRFSGIRRPYNAEDVVSKRGTLHQTYPSSLMGRKLFELLNKRAQDGQPVHTREIPIGTNQLLKSLLRCPSGCYRSNPDDPTSTKSGGALHLWLGLLVSPHYD